MSQKVHSRKRRNTKALNKQTVDYAISDAKIIQEVYDNASRSKYAMQVFIDLHKQGKGRTFGAQCAAFVADHPEEAEMMSEHHIESFLEKKSSMIRPSLTNPILMHQYVKANMRRIKPNA